MGVPDGHVKEKSVSTSCFSFQSKLKRIAKVQEAGEGILQGQVFHIRTWLNRR